jgi:hypothetical protein
MRESEVERYLGVEVKKRGGVSWKWAGTMGVPDRIVLLPQGKILFVEVKTKGGRLSKVQQLIHRKMGTLGIEVEVVWSKDEVDELLR